MSASRVRKRCTAEMVDSIKVLINAGRESQNGELCLGVRGRVRVKVRVRARAMLRVRNTVSIKVAVW